MRVGTQGGNDDRTPNKETIYVKLHFSIRLWLIPSLGAGKSFEK